MDIVQPEANQKILDEITYLQADIEAALKYVLEQSSSKFKPEGREAFHQNIEDTKQLLEHLKSRYGT